VVAAAVATLFSLSLQREGVDGASDLAPAAFVVIIGSVLVASLVAKPAARRLRVDEANPSGVLLAGSQPWMLDAAVALTQREVPVLVLPGEGDEAAAQAGLLTYTGPLDDEELAEAIDAVGIGIAIVSSENDAVSSYLVEQLSDLLGRGQVYRVARASDGAGSRRHRSRSWGRVAFDGLATEPDLALNRWEIVELSGSSLLDGLPAGAIPLFSIRDDSPPEVVDRRARIPTEGVVIAARPLTPLSH
jgi:hypothetical protein